MQSWETIWEKMTTSKEMKEEYRKAFLLNMFQKLVSQMNKNEDYKKRILTLCRQTKDFNGAVRTIYLKEFDYELDSEELDLMAKWMNAYRKKQQVRKAISKDLKKALCEKQGNRCAICNQLLSEIDSQIHVDHIVPWVLVGDELEDNYQALCETCNACKSSKTDYIFKSLLKLV